MNVMAEWKWDEKLKINTVGRLDSGADENHHPYEPTPYTVLKRLAESGYIGEESIVVDYGCGKGRVGFFLNHELGCRVTGVEYDEQIYALARKNLSDYKAIQDKKERIEFVCANAEEYRVGAADCFYFFNPFTVKILNSVLGRILESYYENPRAMQLFFYYPDEEYVASLMAMDELLFLDEIDCRDLFDRNDDRERILVFELGM